MNPNEISVWQDLAMLLAERVAKAELSRFDLGIPKESRTVVIVAAVNEQGQRDRHPLLMIRDREFFNQYPISVEVDYVFEGDEIFSDEAITPDVPLVFAQYLLGMSDAPADESAIRRYRPIAFSFEINMGQPTHFTCEMWMYVDNDNYAHMEEVTKQVLADWHQQENQANPNAVIEEWESEDEYDLPPLEESEDDWEWPASDEWEW